MRNPIIVFYLFIISLCDCQGPIKLINNSLHSGLTERIGNFSMELLYHTAHSQPHEINLIISPITVWTVLAVIAEGAVNDTLTQICKALRISPRRRPEIRNEYKNIAKWLVVNTTAVELQQFNALFIDEFTVPLKDFKDPAKEYNTRMIGANFTDSKVTANLINSAISAVTHGRIPTLVDSSDLENSNLILTSALYFKGQWTHPFDKSFTKKAIFYDSNGVQLGEVNMMYKRYTYPFANIESLEAHVLELPYGKENRLSMLIILPNPGVAPDQILYNLANITLDSVFDELKLSVEQFSEDEIDCYIPRFKIESQIELSDTLKKFDIVDLFSESKARLPLMSLRPVHVTKVIHRAEIEVTEEGTTAAAATASVFSNRISTIQFKANRPFYYLIIEKVTNTVAFTGFYNTPSLY